MRLERDVLSDMLGKCAEDMGLNPLDARQYAVKDALTKQFESSGFVSPPSSGDEIKINLQNGTFVSVNGAWTLREFHKSDFMKYVLPFEYDPTAECPMFMKFLNRVLPDVDCQHILAEYIGWLFVGNMKCEKALFLYGNGANGKSVIFEIIYALLGKENVSNYTMNDLCDDRGYYRAMLMNKLLNYSSEIGGSKINPDTMKQIISGEPLSCRLPHGSPFNIEGGYAKLAFNANTLPKNTEQSNAFFRRFLIIHFGVTIPPEEQDKDLAKKIIATELSGIFNWILEGLNRLVKNNRFTESALVRQNVDQYRMESDSVQMFLADEGYVKSDREYILQKELFSQYRVYCNENNYQSVGNNNFGKRCRAVGYEIAKKTAGMAIYAKKSPYCESGDSFESDNAPF